MLRLSSIAVALQVVLMAQVASAHYLWLGLDAKGGDNGTINLYFEEGPRPGDGQYLDPFVERGKNWFRTADKPEPQSLELAEVKKDGKRWLSAELAVAGPRAVESYGKWGVYRYGQTDILLHYYARYLDVSSAEQLAPLASAKHLDIHIVPKVKGSEVQLQVLWKGEPAAKRPVYIRGAGLNKNVTTDEKGIVSFEAEKAGQYTLRTYVELDQAGTDNDKAYQKVRHHGTLVMNLPLGDG